MGHGHPASAGAIPLKSGFELELEELGIGPASRSNPSKIRNCEWNWNWRNWELLLHYPRPCSYSCSATSNRLPQFKLVTYADVKKMYRKACLAVHPDKQMGSENENISKLIFTELNDAWAKFQEEESP